MEGPSPTPCICTEIRRAARTVSACYDEALAPVGVTAAQYALLSSLKGHQPCSVSQLAHGMALDRSTLARNLKPLTAEGYVVDAANGATRDRRLLLSGKGERTLREALPLWEMAQERVRALLGRGRADALKELLSELGALIPAARSAEHRYDADKDRKREEQNQ